MVPYPHLHEGIDLPKPNGEPVYSVITITKNQIKPYSNGRGFSIDNIYYYDHVKIVDLSWYGPTDLIIPCLDEMDFIGRIDYSPPHLHFQIGANGSSNPLFSLSPTAGLDNWSPTIHRVEFYHWEGGRTGRINKYSTDNYPLIDKNVSIVVNADDTQSQQYGVDKLSYRKVARVTYSGVFPTPTYEWHSISDTTNTIHIVNDGSDPRAQFSEPTRHQFIVYITDTIPMPCKSMTGYLGDDNIRAYIGGGEELCWGKVYGGLSSRFTLSS